MHFLINTEIPGSFKIGLDIVVLSLYPSAISRAELDSLFIPYDLKRLEMYSRNMVDYHLIMDLVPSIARLFFLNQLGDISLSAAQSVGTTVRTSPASPLFVYVFTIVYCFMSWFLLPAVSFRFSTCLE